MKGKMKHAVSLIVLVVTILVLSIIAAAVIISLSNANIMGKASNTTFKQDMANYKETYEMYVTNLFADNPTYDRTSLDATYENDTNLFIKIFGEVEEKYQKGLMIIGGRLVYDTEDEAEKKILVELNMDVREKLPEVEELEKISKDKSYVGHYVKIGDEYAVIFADLAFDGSGEWSETNSCTYSYSAVSDKTTLKDYVITKEKYTSKFGTNYVLEVVEETEKLDRFYVMSVNDFVAENGKSVFYWYYSAYETRIPNYASVTSTNFESGRQNTYTMINRWNEDMSEDKNTVKDMWGLIQEKVYGANYTKETKTIDDIVWFIPSKDEWSAFATYVQSLTSEPLKSVYFSEYGLTSQYWSSSLAGLGTDARLSYLTAFSLGYLYSYDISYNCSIRMAAYY